MSSPITERLRSNPISMPLMADPMSVTAMMPMITPSAVRIERILCARIWLNAIRKLSVSSMVMSFIGLQGVGSGKWGVGERTFFSPTPYPPQPTPHSLRLRFVNRHFRAVLQLAADDGVAAGDDFVAWFDAVLDLDERGVGDAGLHWLHAHDVAVLQKNDALQFVAALALFLFFQRLIGDFRFVVVVLAHVLRALFLALFGREF